MAECPRARTPNGSLGALCGCSTCYVCGSASRSLEEINAENGRRAAQRAAEEKLWREKCEWEDLFAHGCAIIGSRIWDGGRTHIPTSDIDVFLNVDPGVVDRFRSRTKTFVESVPLLHTGLIRHQMHLVTNIDLVGGGGHWALTGREERQCIVLSGDRPQFMPAPANATSSMIRRSALKIMGVKTCLPSRDVDDTHHLCQPEAITNSYRWVRARALHWEDSALAELADRIEEALRAQIDVRQVL